MLNNLKVNFVTFWRSFGEKKSFLADKKGFPISQDKGKAAILLQEYREE